MPLTLLRHASQKPPPGPLKLDIAHPLAVGLRAMFVCNEIGSKTVFDLVSGATLNLKGSATWGSTGGVGGLITNAALAGAEITCPASLQLQFPISIVWKGTILGTPDGYVGIFGVVPNNTDAGPYESYDLGCRVDTTYRVNWNNGSQQVLGAIGGTPLPAPGPAWLAGTLASGAQKLYVNDPLVVNNTGSGSGTISYTGSALLHFGEQTGPGARNPACLHECGHIYNRILSTDDLAWLKTEPYAMLQTRPLQRWFTVAAPSFDPSVVPWPVQPQLTPGAAVVGF